MQEIIGTIVTPEQPYPYEPAQNKMINVTFTDKEGIDLRLTGQDTPLEAPDEEIVEILNICKQIRLAAMEASKPHSAQSTHRLVERVMNRYYPLSTGRSFHPRKVSVDGFSYRNL